MKLQFTAMPTKTARKYQNGGVDAYGLAPERGVSGGAGNPCRHCLRDVPQGAAMLILAHRPFPAAQPYAETGPIFLCAEACERGGGNDVLPISLTSDQYITRGYDPENRIVYGTGRVTPTSEIHKQATALLQDATIAYVHVRSASNNCFAVRIDRV